jgi:hypothetical protein
MVFLVRGSWAADVKAPRHASSEFSLLEVGATSAPSAFNEIQRNYVLTWIRSTAPECPVEAAPAVVEKFLEELQSRHPEALERMQGTDFPAHAYESMLLRQVALQLGGSRQAEQREAVARRRVQALLAIAGGGVPGVASDSPAMLAKIKNLSEVSYRRLVEGRVDDDDLLVLFKQAGTAGVERKEVAGASAKPKELTAAEIVSEFARRNQAGAALTKLRAYCVEAQLKPVGGAEQHLLLFKMRPDRFRMQVQVEGLSRYILAFDGQRYWQQVPGRPAEEIPPGQIDSRRNLREFVDPLFEAEGAEFGRLADGAVAGRNCYRLAVKTAGGQKYVACIDRENFHELGRENEDGARVTYTDFREVAGLTLSFREEAVDHEGHAGVLEVARITPNPGLIPAFFEAPAQLELDFFGVERLTLHTATTAATAGKAN